MRLRAVGKAIFVTALLVAAVVTLFYGSFLFIFALDWLQRGLAVAMIAAALRGFVWAFDLMWERPVQWSTEPWRNDWEEVDRAP